MKIVDVQPYIVWGGARNYVFVVIDTDEGLSGIGEAGLTWHEQAIAGAVEQFKTLLVGEDPMRIEHLWQVMARGSFFPAGKIAGAALSAIDIALWDLQGKRFGVPVYQLLGGRVRDRVVCYPHNTGRTVDELVSSCKQSVAEGWKFVRWGIAPEGSELEPERAVRRGIEEVAAVRAAVGEDIGLCYDVHTRLDAPDVIRLCREVERYHPFFIEDPLRSEGPFSLRHVREHTSVPLAVGEQFCNKWEFREVIEQELTDYARIDLCIAGGITEARKIAGWCETHYIKLAVHNPLGPVSAAACLHLNLATTNFGVQEQPRRPGTLLTDVVTVQVPFDNGYLLPPTLPGLGVEFNREAARARPYQPSKGPRLVRADGSFTNW
jgi:galactonate dehydratase